MRRQLSRPLTRELVWASWVVGALLLLPVLHATAYTIVVSASALLLVTLPHLLPPYSQVVDRTDLIVVAGLYLAVVGLMRLAFVGFTTDHVAGLFLSFATALVLGVAGPVVYTVWVRERPLADLGLRRGDLHVVVPLALLFGGVQFGLTLWGYDLPVASEWVPLLVMSLVVGAFEAVFFRGFVQTRLEAQFGPVAGIAGAAMLYGLYHVGFGMDAGEIVFLTGLDIVYAVAFALARSVLVLWPFLTPLGSFFANVESGDIDLPWASIAGFADVFAVMAVVIWLAFRHQRRHAPATAEATRTHVSV